MLTESSGLYEKLSAYEFLEFMGALYDVPSNILRERIDDLLNFSSSMIGAITFSKGTVEG